VDDATLAARLHEALLTRRLTVASAESLTGGGLGALLSGTPGASETYVGGVISYATGVKQRVLGVRAETVAEDGVVSARCAEEMAAGARDLMRADVAVSTTGVAGPTEQEGKPVGTVFVGVAGPWGVSAHALHVDGDRATIRRSTCAEALSLVLFEVDAAH